MNIYLPNQEKLTSIEYHTSGEYKGYIDAVFYMDECGEIDILFRVYAPQDGNSENVITWTSTPIPQGYEAIVHLVLSEISEKCNLKSALDLEISEKIAYMDIKLDDGNKQYYLYINNDTGYSMEKWTIAEAIADYCTPEAETGKYNSWYSIWCD